MHHNPKTLTFHDFFEPELLEGLDAMGFEKPTPIQEQAIPLILAGTDLIACAQTGTGKTAAFLLPVMNKLIQEPRDAVDTLVIVPTRELAIQIDEAVQGFAYFTNISSIAIYGGSDGISYEQEKKALTLGAHIIIATPGRLIAHLNQGYVKFQQLRHLILDEADRMLDMGFLDDLYRIISFIPRERQTLLFSATMPPKIRTLAKNILQQPAEINIAVSRPAEKVVQGVYYVHNNQKNALIRQLLTGRDQSSILIFSSTKSKVKELERDLIRMGLHAAAIHSDLQQDQRNEVLRNFKNRKLPILVATDILSRGIDIDSIELVINFDVPQDAEDYVHRVGRTARAEATGVALTFVSPAERRKFRNIEELIGMQVKSIPLPPGLPEPKEQPVQGQRPRGRHQPGQRRKPRPRHQGGQG